MLSGIQGLDSRQVQGQMLLLLPDQGRNELLGAHACRVVLWLLLEWGQACNVKDAGTWVSPSRANMTSRASLTVMQVIPAWNVVLGPLGNLCYLMFRPRSHGPTGQMVRKRKV